MAQTILSNLVDEQDVLSNEKVVDMDDEIKMLDPDETQFATITMKARSKPAINPKVEWLEDQFMPRVTTTAASGTSAVTTITVAAGTGDYFRAYDIARIPSTGEAVRVDSISTDTLTVTRGLGTTTAAAFAASVQLVILNNAAAEGATLGTRKMTKTVAGYNYCQIIRHPFGFSNTAAATKFFGGNQPGREGAKKLVEHKRAIEAGFFWGPRGIDTSLAQPRRYMGGAIEYIATYVKSVGGTLSKSLLDSYLTDGFAHGSRNKVLFASPVVGAAISGFLRDAWQPPTVGDSLFGAQVTGYISGTYGFRVPVIVKREWAEMSSASSQYGSQAMLLDLDYVWARPLRPTAIYRNRQANDADETTHEYLTEISLEFAQEACHLLMKGATG